MLISRIPWEQAAVLVRDLGHGERRIAAEGSLLAIVVRIASTPEASWHNFSINLPDRHVAPFAYRPGDFAALVGAQQLRR